jgi:hypothetical protein
MRRLLVIATLTVIGFAIAPSGVLADPISIPATTTGGSAVVPPGGGPPLLTLNFTGDGFTAVGHWDFGSVQPASPGQVWKLSTNMANASMLNASVGELGALALMRVSHGHPGKSHPGKSKHPDKSKPGDDELPGSGPFSPMPVTPAVSSGQIPGVPSTLIGNGLAPSSTLPEAGLLFTANLTGNGTASLGTPASLTASASAPTIRAAFGSDQATPTPEPAAGLLAFGGLALVFFVHRWRAAHRPAPEQL